MEENEVIVLFVEGDTEIEFYNSVKSKLKSKSCKNNNIKIETINAKGIGQYKDIVFRKFEKNIRIKYPNCDNFHIICTYDTDIFDLNKKPYIEWTDVKKQFINTEICTFDLIKAKQSIEDWFLYDIEGILKYLRLPKNTKVSGKNGEDKLKKLFKKANKIYIKGRSSRGFIDALDVSKIMKKVCSELVCLCKYMTIKCEKIK